MKKQSIYLSLLFAFVLGMTACGSDNSTNAGASGKSSVIYGQMVDPADGQVYKTVQIGNRVWMARNYNYNPVDYNSNRPEEYGSKFSRVTPNGCPVGWHVSTFDDWIELSKFLEREGANYEDLAAKGYDNVSSLIWAKAKDTYGFSMVPAGIHTYVSRFDGASFWIGPGETYSGVRYGYPDSYVSGWVRYKKIVYFTSSDYWTMGTYVVQNDDCCDVTASIRCVQD